MTKLDLTQYRNRMFADRCTDINDALDYALSLTTGNPEGLTAMYVVLNTVINAVQADSLAAANRWGELLSTDAPPAAAESVTTAIVISAAVRDWLTDNAGDMVNDWCSDNAGDAFESWMENNANDMIADMVTDQVEGMQFTVTASR